ncbi:tetratricopeptide repeat protein [Algoriphagus sp. AK58]|uniref:tetratricopeptide repeat-containing sensor histidine kinase n=1 Tax=Algoriphagus sp. AK58 TaxID=1406877 RepID=UPI0016500CE0|nr:tetratricopeptide repeat protein [Algoriphagus sp. AK58]
MDSLKKVLERSDLPDTTRVNLLIELCEASTFTEEQGGKAYAEEALEISKKVRFAKGEGQANNSIGAYYLQVGDLEKALSFVLEAERVYKKAGDFSANLLAVYNNLGIIYNRTGETQKAIEVYKSAIQLAESEKNAQSQAILYNNLGSAYDNLKQYDSALWAFEKVEEVSLTAGIQVGVMMAKSNLGSVYFSIGELSKSEEEYLQGLKIAEEGQFTRNIATILLGLADVYSAQAKLGDSEEYYQRGLKIAEEIQSWPLIQDGYEGLALVQEKRGNLTGALQSFRKWQQARDSIFSQEKIQTLEELKARYESEKKEAEILALSQENEIQTLELAQKNQFLIFGGIGMVLLVSLGYSYFQRKKLKSEAQMAEIEQRFLRSQLNPHFIFNALSSIQNFMLKSEGKTASRYLGKFSKLMRQVLENSRLEFIQLEEEIRMLENYLEIQKILVQKEFDFQIECHESLDQGQVSIPPMFVQPFLENAIQHGLMDSGGRIDVEFKLAGDYIEISVRDNGVGILSTSQAKENHRSLATSIIRERIDNYNKKLKNRIQLKMLDRSEQNEKGTEVQLLVPFLAN